ncbi:MAG: NAD(P)-dependent oxidoreductase [Dehalococcoidia bacterium]|nr:NAD(P)-dependent oxidoreductase [Dehalococcoidia bacterium]
MEVLGFVGLGNMGGAMSARLVSAGHQLVVFDIAGTLPRMPPGASAAASVAAVAALAHTVFLSLPDGPASREVCRQVAGASPRETTTVVDLSTIGISAAVECASILASAGITYVDSPVSGGVTGARAGTLAAMVGAREADFERVQPLLMVMAKNVFRVGDKPGKGQAMKLLNNFLSATSLAATSEAVVFGARMGLDLVTMIEVINASSGRTTASTDKFPRSVIPRTYDFGFSAALMTKDVSLYLENASAAGVPIAMGAATASLFLAFKEACPDADFTYIHKWLEDKAGR